MCYTNSRPHTAFSCILGNTTSSGVKIRRVNSTCIFEEEKQMAKKWVYLFTEGNATMRNLLGGKGA